MPPLHLRPALLPRGSSGCGCLCPLPFALPLALLIPSNLKPPPLQPPQPRPPPRAFFSSTCAARSSQQPRLPRQRIPPESPLFINVPNPPQDQSIEAARELKPVKGHLPVPRAVFRQRDGHLKSTAEFLARSAPEPGPGSAGTAGAGLEIQEWKRRMAAARRASMASGLRGLWERKTLRDERRTRERTRRLAENRAAATAPEREDERLTRASVNARTLDCVVRPDPLRLERAEESRRRTAAVLAERSERRRDAVQELYMSARRGFIVDEAGLEAAVEREFGDGGGASGASGGDGSTGDRYRGRSPSNQPITSIWDLEGSPDTVADMLREVSGRDGRVVVDLPSQKTKTEKRQKRVAEELTGGKMD